MEAVTAPRPRTKLVCTIGPASVGVARELVDVGMSVGRINFSHGTPDSQKEAVHAVRAAAHHARRSVAIMVDLPGPKVRLQDMDPHEVELTAGQVFDLHTNRPTLAQEVRPGDRLMLADGAVELRVIDPADDGETVRTEVISGGVVRSRSGVSVPTDRLDLEGLTDEDRAAIPRALELRADLIAQSFVRTADDVRALRAVLPRDNGPLVVAKIETRAGVENFEEICAAADGVMVARGDLGVDIPFAEVPLVQKDLLRRAQAQGRFAIVATQMLESMTAAARPTRAEASDVANAVLDGTDAVMLSAETAIGAHPVEAARAMLEICAMTEARGVVLAPRSARQPADDHPAAICRAAVELAENYRSASAIWCFTRSGRTAELLSLFDPKVPIVSFTVNAVVARRLAVRRAIMPIVLPQAGGAQPLIERMAAAALAQHLIDANGQTIVFVTTSPDPGGVNRLELALV